MRHLKAFQNLLLDRFRRPGMMFLRLLEDIKHRFLVLSFLEVVPDFHFAHQSATWRCQRVRPY